jgi:sialate O-acetylesterase
VISKPIELKNVLVGDVFLFARQSSIDVSLGTTPEGKKAAKRGKGFRFIRIKTSPSRTPLDNLNPDATEGWMVANKKSALTMSAAAFYLGRDLVKQAGVPIGIVDLDMGHHFAGAWLSEEGVDLAQKRPGPGTGDVNSAQKLLPAEYEAWDKRISGYQYQFWDKRVGYLAKGTPLGPKPEVSSEPPPGLPPEQRAFSPSVCYNAVIHPLQGLVVKGMLLQLGNDYPYYEYKMLPRKDRNVHIYPLLKQASRMTPHVLPEAVDDMRRSLGDPALPVAWIMPPGSDNHKHANHNREVRELQRRARAEANGVDLILPGTKHIRSSGQPADEALLADRCKQWVMGTFYGTGGPVSGPIFDRVEYGEGAATIFFKAGTAVGLSAKGDALDHFELAGEDTFFSPCKARIEGTRVALTCDEVSKPMHVRFGWNRKPVQGLVNGAGLPAIPFNTDATWEYGWWPEPATPVLPEEYRTTVNRWPESDVLIHNGQNVLMQFGAADPPHIGPTGIWTAKFGPNLYVHEVTPGSPADGKVFKDDMIYGANGKVFGTANDDNYRDMAAAITASETEAGGGRLTLKIRRKGKLIEVPIQLEVMGSFSATTPWTCEKSRRIVEKAEEYMRSGLRPETGFVKTDDYIYGPWYDNVLFLLASGNPEMQGLVRRGIYQILDDTFIARESDRRPRHDSRYNLSEPPNPGGGWEVAYMVMLLGEYYHRTGDPNILPYYQYLVTKATPPRPLHPGYGTHPALVMPSLMGLVMAKEAGLKLDETALQGGLDYFYFRRAENACVMYVGYPKGDFDPSSVFPNIDEAEPMNPKEKATGRVRSWNGKLGTAAALYSMLEGKSKAVKACSSRCVYAYNRTRSGHGGVWFNNFWTPVGAYHAGEKDYQSFMKGQQWWRELYRDHTGAMWQAGNAKRKMDTLGVGYAIHRVAHHKRLRMFGAPRSAFGPGAPSGLKEALAAHRKRNYALAVKLVQKELAGRQIPASDRPTMQHFLETVQTLAQSVEYDLAYTENLLKKDRFYLASLELPQLKMVVAPGNARLQAIVAALESAEAKAKIAAVIKQVQDEAGRIHGETKAARSKRGAEWKEQLARIVTLVKDDKRYSARKNVHLPEYPKERWNRWRVVDFEARDQIPENWQQPDYDDSSWDEVTLPTLWTPNHTGLLRTTFEVEDASAFDCLLVRMFAFKQNGVEIFLNGHVVAKVHGIEKPRWEQSFKLTPYAMSLLKNGVNTLAVSAVHGDRWVDFSFRLEGHLKSREE